VTAKLTGRSGAKMSEEAMTTDDEWKLSDADRRRIVKIMETWVDLIMALPPSERMVIFNDIIRGLRAHGHSRTRPRRGVPQTRRRS
jgi:hypothetical protein